MPSALTAVGSPPDSQAAIASRTGLATEPPLATEAANAGFRQTMSREVESALEKVLRR